MASSSTSEWLHFHQNNNPSTGQVAQPPPASDLLWPSHVSEATTVSTTIGSASPSPPQMGPGGRVSKPARRRTRASRRTPTTLLNTDTSNFRAMVQQFTGGPNSVYPPTASGFSLSGPHNFSTGRPASQAQRNLQEGSAQGLGYGGLQLPIGQLQPLQIVQQYNTMPSANNNSNGNNNRNMDHHQHDDGFLQRMVGDPFTGSNVNETLPGSGSGSTSFENRSSNSFPF